MEKKWLYFLIGVAVGTFVTFFCYRTYVINILYSENAQAVMNVLGNLYQTSEKMELFDEPADCVHGIALKIEQVIEPNLAIAELGTPMYEGSTTLNNDIDVVLTNNNGKTYYDGQFIIIPNGKCARQIGVYKLKEAFDIESKTLPLVVIE